MSADIANCKQYTDMNPGPPISGRTYGRKKYAWDEDLAAVELLWTPIIKDVQDNIPGAEEKLEGLKKDMREYVRTMGIVSVAHQIGHNGA